MAEGELARPWIMTRARARLRMKLPMISGAFVVGIDGDDGASGLEMNGRLGARRARSR